MTNKSIFLQKITFLPPYLYWFFIIAGVALLHWQQSVLGWACVLAGWVWFLVRPVRPADAQAAPALSRRAELIWVAAIMLVAVGLRWQGLEAVPPACWFDEAQNGLETLRILSGDWFFFTPNNNGRGALQFFWTAPFFWVFGSTVTSLRLASAVIGVATVPLVWLLGRKLASAWVGLFAAAFLACSYWHVSISRLGFDAIMTPAFDAAFLLCLVLAVKTRAWTWFAAAGVLVGLANYGYAASRASLLLLVLALILIVRSVPDGWQRYRKGILASGLAALIVLAPLLYLTVRRPDVLGERPSQVLAPTAGAMLRNLRATLRMFHERGDGNARHNLPGRPMLDPAVGALALAGLALAWQRRRGAPRPKAGAPPNNLASPANSAGDILQRRCGLPSRAHPGLSALQDGFSCQLAVAWLGVYTLLAGMLTDAAPHGLRMLSAVIPASLLAAWGLQQALADLRLHTPGRRALALAVLFAAMAGATAYAYFRVYPRHPATRPAFSPHAYEVGRFLRTLPAGTLVQVSRRFDPGVVSFVSGREERVPDLDFSVTESRPDPWVRIMLSPDEAPWFMQSGAYAWREIQTPQGERFWVCEWR